ncbi:Farnesyl pyrophosphate synthase [Histomonas meleagridis]|uniref:Farnesyl pyrophosphate synthase n=1 Tax=Histomonas meleagridis TaxID=135588 RepID=UPI0035599AF8|nr:Farnesyl pyrophosphate synthase [Histomonas meleagridis]KAH0803092.1 Farnesyl pyrophosphate synthase [Histomonas meleagridis]
MKGNILSAFQDYFPKIIEIINEYLRPRTVDFVLEHVNKLVNYSLKGGKNVRGTLAASTYLELTGFSPSDNFAQVGYILGWSIELLQAAYLVADDLMDQSETRRGQKCWYLLDGIGNSATNDALLVENLVFVLINYLRERFLDDETVDEIISIFRYISTITTIGQTYDSKAESFTLDCYKIIVENKTAYYTFWLPISVSMIASQKLPKGKYNDKSFTQFMLDIGYFFQSQDDYLDVYCDEVTTGKKGTDIIDRKVTWFSCKAYELGNESQKEAIMKVYENPDQRYEAVMKVYEDLGLKQLFENYSDKEYEKLSKELKELDPVFPKNTLSELLGSLMKRNK